MKSRTRSTSHFAGWILVASLGLGCATLTPAEKAQQAVGRAEEARRTQDLSKAAAEYARALEADPTHLVALRGLVETHHLAGRLEELETRFTRQVALEPGNAYAHEALGLVYFAKGAGHGAAARKHLEQATLLAPEVIDFHYRLGVLLVEHDAYAQAKESLKKAVDGAPKDARYRLPYAVSLARTGDREGAVAQLAAVLDLDPEPAQVQLAERTAKVLLDPFRGFPTAAREQFELAMTWLSSEQATQAAGVLDSLLQRYPDLAVVHSLSGLAAAKSDDAGRAIAAFRRAIELDPQLAEPRMYLGDVYFSRGRPESAREHYQAAVERNPYLADAWHRLAEGHLKSEDREQAAHAFARYLLLRPGDVDSALVYAAVLGDMRRPEAGRVWDQLAQRFPHRVPVLVGHAKHWYVAAVRAGDNDKLKREAKAKAKASLERAVQLDQENVTASAMLAEINRL